MVKNHLKRLAAPQGWKIGRKEHVWVTRPMPGAHPIKECLTLDRVLKDLGYAKTAREVKFILNNKDILVDKIVRKKKNFTVGLMDVIEVPKMEKSFRVSYNSKGEMVLIGIDNKEVSVKLLKVKSKTAVKKSKIHVGFHDGKSIVLDKAEMNVGDSVLYDMDKKSVVKTIPLEKGALILVIRGKQKGFQGVVKEIVERKGLTKASCNYEIGKETYSTLKDYVFVIGKGKSEVKLNE